MAYDYVTANNIQTDIITMQIEHIKKLSLIGTNPQEYSIKTAAIYQTRKHQDLKFKIN